MKRQICIITLLLSGAVLTGCSTNRPGIARTDVSNLRRLYDFTPVSATNPVVAGVRDRGIEIPVSELRSYVNAMPDSMPPTDGSKRPPLTLDQKRALLEKLINEHFLMWAGYQQKADQTEGVARLLKITQAMLLRETLMNQEVGARAKTSADYQRLADEFYGRIFDRTRITVSNEAYDQLKATVRLPKLTAGTPSAATSISSAHGLDKLAPPVRQAVLDSIQQANQPSISDQLTPEARDRVFARCKIGLVTVGDFLTFYEHIPADQRPDLEKQDEVTAMLKQMLKGGLLTEEARARGLEKAPIVLEKMQLNRNKMVRMYELNQIAAEAAARMNEPGQEAQVKLWYMSHLKDRYTYKDDNGKEQVISYDQQRERIESDYVDDLREQLRAEHMRAMHKDHPVEIDEKVLEQTVL